MITKKLPMKEAIEAAAQQNYERDRRVLQEFSQPWEKALLRHKKMYREEAKYLLETTGENYVPDEPDTEHIVV